MLYYYNIIIDSIYLCSYLSGGSSTAFSVHPTRHSQLSRDDPAAAAADDDDDDDRSLTHPRLQRQDDTLYVILGVVVGAVFIGVLITLFICVRQQHKQRLLIG